jgi:phosphatidylserine/phosphatidylglycerophosphate/cardiolipin synthase-like enzyme
MTPDQVIRNKVLFSPKAYIARELVHLIDAAMEDIVVAMYLFSSKYIAKALARAAEESVCIRVILDQTVAEKSYSLDEWMLERGIDIRFIKVRGGIMHHKFCIFDRSMLVTGSYNLTYDAEYRNHEGVIFTPDQGIINPFYNRFDFLWRKSAADIDQRYSTNPLYHYHTVPLAGKAYWHPVSYVHRKSQIEGKKEGGD